jgi:heptosyltransferase-2
VQTLVIRFSSLGDIVLAGSVTGALAPVTFLTHSRYADLAAALPGVTQVIRWGEDAIEGPFSRIVDLHGSPRSRWVARTQRGPCSTIARQSLARRLRVWFKRKKDLNRVVDRYARAAGGSPKPKPWIPVDGPRDALFLIPGARWASKKWPLGRWLELGQGWTGPIVLLGGPDELGELRQLAEILGSRASVIAERGFTQTLSVLGRGASAVGGDTGLLHLCAATGMPVLGLFGPTTSSDGFWCHEGQALEVSLPCRPCSRHGENGCPMGDHLCMESLSVAQVRSALESLT